MTILELNLKAYSEKSFKKKNTNISKNAAAATLVKF